LRIVASSKMKKKTPMSESKLTTRTLPSE
jgi:hypothetical protein